MVSIQLICNWIVLAVRRLELCVGIIKYFVQFGKILLSGPNLEAEENRVDSFTLYKWGIKLY